MNTDDMRSALWFISKNPGVAVERAFAYWWVALFVWVFHGTVVATAATLTTAEIIMLIAGIYLGRPSWPDKTNPRDRGPGQ